MKKTFNDYQKFIAKLYAACDVSDYPDGAVMVDVNAVSDILEDEFIKVGLLDCDGEDI